MAISETKLIHGQKLGMLSINEMGRERLAWRLKALRDLQRQEYAAGLMGEPERQGDGAPSERAHDVVLMAGLPMLWGDEPEHEPKAGAENGPEPDTAR
jgi:hypothetical protein